MVDYVPDLLQTKLAIPSTRADRVPRLRLIQQLNASLEHPLTLICAPAGFGKTSLITDWHEQSDRFDFPLVWLSLDEDDNDPTRFLIYLISALESVGGMNSAELLASLQSPQPSAPKVILTALISRIEALDHRFVLVLDDYHRVTSPVLREALIFLLDHMPSQMRLVITSREDPPLPLSRLRGRGELAEIRANDLRFTSDEAAQFLQQMLGVNLSAGQIADLDARTEGWIAGLQLAALAMKGRQDISAFIAAFTGSHRYILDYLTEEVLSRQPESMQNFLLQTSILTRMNGELCDAVTGRADGQVMLEQIERSNLFLIALDDERYWYRYHHLFADMLQRRLKQSSPDSMTDLYQRASLWFEQNGALDEAVANSLLGDDDEHAAHIAEQHAERLWRDGELAMVLRWLDVLPKAALEARPTLGLKYAFILTLNDTHLVAEKHLEKAEQALLQQPASPEQIALLGQAAVIRASIYTRLADKRALVLTAGQQALSQLPQSDTLWRAWVMGIIGTAYFDVYGNVLEAERYLLEALDLSEKAHDLFTMAGALSTLTSIYISCGKLRKAEMTTERFLQLPAEAGWKDQAFVDRCRIRYELNELQGALEDAAETQRIALAYSHNRILMQLSILWSRLHQTLGNKTEARSLIQQAIDRVRTENLQGDFGQLFAAQALLWLTQGDFNFAVGWAQAAESFLIDQREPIYEFEQIVLARIQIAQGRLDEAQQLLERLFSAADAGGRMGRVIWICILQALVSRLQGNLEKALESLQYALSLAEPEGYVRIFVDEGAPMKALLREAREHGVEPAYVTKLLAAFGDEVSMATLNIQPLDTPDHDIEALSVRELEVLRLIVDGASNREIAERLFVSLGTVKKHLSNIFIKLDAKSRTQVIATAKQHNLL